MKKIYEHGIYKLELNDEDPDTPAMVYKMDGDYSVASGSYDCVMGTGLMHNRELHDVEVPMSVQNWLDSYADEVTEFFSRARKGLPEYS